jgi:hypothetical protein
MMGWNRIHFFVALQGEKEKLGITKESHMDVLQEMNG